LGIIHCRTDKLKARTAVKSSEGFITSRYTRSFPINLILSAVLCIVFTLGAIALKPCHAEGDMDALTAALSEYLDCFRLELMGIEKQQLAVMSKNFCLTTVYHHKALRPYWVTPKGPGPKASIVLDFLNKAENEGLDPKNYEIDQISELFEAHTPRSLARLDALLTFNLIKYIHDV
jgi:murein L,D-transpeptidase YcbB/YkuD